MATHKQVLRGIGRRKSAIARVQLTPGEPEERVNNMPLATYFPTLRMQVQARQALVLTSQEGSFGIRAKVSGGGKQAQAHAVRLAVARAIVLSDPLRKKQLRDAGLLTRDARIKERKKPGLKRARRAPQFSKR